MRYLFRGHEIRSENGAKPATQASKELLEWIRTRPLVAEALDFGCGKLRYAGPLASRARRLTIVDSPIQLERTQMLCGLRTSVRAYARSRWKHVRSLDTAEFSRDRVKYDLALCANVLSTIPSPTTRAAVVRLLARK